MKKQPIKFEVIVARIAGVNIPTDKRVEISLTYIFGIGRVTAQKICKEAGIQVSKRVRDLSDDEVIRLREIIDASFVIEGALRKEIAMNIKRLIEMKSYRGKRHIMGLPVRGQRTHTNARTRKGRARVAVAGKKKITK